MLQPIMHILNKKKITLASRSPTRKQALEDNGMRVDICPSLFEENLDPSSFEDISEFVIETAYQKVLEVEGRLQREGRSPDIIIGADTVVTLDGKLYEKPKSKEESFKMLKSLSGRIHTVYTGVVVKTADKEEKFSKKTEVVFGELSDEQINGYIATEEPMDKVGAYGIQGIGGTLVKKIDGQYFTELTMPVFSLAAVLYEMFEDTI